MILSWMTLFDNSDIFDDTTTTLLAHGWEEQEDEVYNEDVYDDGYFD